MPVERVARLALYAVDDWNVLAANLLAEGRGADCPVAIVEDGFGANQRVTISSLGEVVRVALEVGVKAPAVIIIGDVVNLASAASSSLKESVKESND